MGNDQGHAHDHEAKASGHAHGHEAIGHDHDVKASAPPAESRSTSTSTERRQARRLTVVVFVIAAFFVVELMGAKAARSDVLEADAYHLLMDVFALVISLGAMRLATARPSARFTYGLRRVEPLAAVVNGVLVFGVAIELVRDAVGHLADPTMPRPGLMLLVASGALVVNGFSAWVLHGAMHVHAGHDHGHAPGPAAHDHGAHGGHDHGAHDHAAHKGHDHAAHKGHDRAAHDHDDAGDDDEGHHAAAHAAHLNLRGAWLHLLGDALGSLAAFVAGLAIRFGASPIVDPLASFLVVAILVIGALRLLRDAGLVLLDAAPPRLPVGRVRKTVLAHPGVRDVHALHVWSLGTGHDAVTVHVTSDGADPNLGTALGDVLRSRYAAEYVTVQVDVVDSAGAPVCALRE